MHEAKAITRWVENNLGRGLSSFYKLEFKELIRLETRKDYEQELLLRMEGWDSKFKAYWERYEEPEVDKVSWWTIKKLGWKGYTDLSLWTTNMSEGNNNLFR